MPRSESPSSARYMRFGSICMLSLMFASIANSTPIGRVLAAPTEPGTSKRHRAAPIEREAPSGQKAQIERGAPSPHGAPPAMTSDQINEKMKEAGAMFREKDWNHAILAYSSVLAVWPNDTRALVDRGICLCRVKEYKKAINDFNAALKRDPKIGRAYQHRGYAFLKLGKYENTVADASKAIGINQTDRYAFRDRSQAYAKLGKFDLAQKDYAAQQKLNRAALEYRAALDMQHHGQFTAALLLFEKNERQHPGMFNPNYRRAIIYTKLGMYDEAIKMCSEFIFEHPRTFEGRRLRAINYLQLGNLAKAIDDADAALKLDHNAVDPYYVKARAAVYDKNYAEAIKNYSAIIQKQPVHELAARMERADAYTELGEFDKAVSDYDSVAKAQPDDETVYHHRAGVFLKMHNYDKAIADLQKFVQLAPKDAMSLMSLAEGLYQAQRYSEAVAMYSKAIALDASSPTLFNGRAKAYEKLNDTNAANKDREQARKLRETE